MNIGKVVSVVESEPIEFDESVFQTIPPLEYITIEISEAPVLEPVPA